MLAAQCAGLHCLSVSEIAHAYLIPRARRAVRYYVTKAKPCIGDGRLRYPQRAAHTFEFDREIGIVVDAVGCGELNGFAPGA